MGIFKDWSKDNRGVALRYQAKELFSPQVWLKLRKWRKQRMNRGWSDRDVWDAGEYIAKMTADMLQDLNDNKYNNWPEWFKLNVQEEGKGAYKNLQSVIDDINAYLDFTETSWADGLECEGNLLDPEEEEFQSINTTWRYKKSGNKVPENRLKGMIKKHGEKEMALYKKATKAMAFFGRHFGSFWD